MPTTDEGFAAEVLDSSPAEGVALDLELIEKIKAEALIQAGYSFTDEDGDVRCSTDQLRSAALQAMQEDHVVAGKKDLATNSVTKFELYVELLPDGPGTRSLPRTPEEKIAQKELMRTVWSYANVGITGFVQKHVAPLGLVLCEAQVARTKLNEETGKRQPTTEPGRFLTADGELIMVHFTGPAGSAFLAAARKLDRQLGLVADRRPELAVPVAKQLGSTVKQAVASVPHADPRAVAALTAGADAESEGA